MIIIGKFDKENFKFDWNKKSGRVENKVLTMSQSEKSLKILVYQGSS